MALRATESDEDQLEGGQSWLQVLNRFGDSEPSDRSVEDAGWLMGGRAHHL